MKMIFFGFILGLFSLIPRPAQSAAALRQNRVCGYVNAPGKISCNVRILTDSHGAPLASRAPQGYSPQELRSAYGVSGRAGHPRVVAIVAAHDNPTIVADLA